MTAWTTIRVCASQEPAASLYFAPAGGGQPLGPSSNLDRAMQAIERGRFDCAAGRWLDVLPSGADTTRLVIIGLGAGHGSGDWTVTGRDVVAALSALRLPAARVPSSRELGGEESLTSLLAGALDAGFRREQGRLVPPVEFRPEQLIADRDDAHIVDGVVRNSVPTHRARAWVDQPANLLTPENFAFEAAEALAASGVAVQILGRAELEAMGAGAILAVSSASSNEPQLLVAEWRGDPSRSGWDVAMVGKGLTFDSGGLNVKAAPVIEKMRLDMAGGAAVICALELAASRRIAVNAVVVVPMVENLIGSAGFRPGDVVRSMSGRTIEVINTDAEGRLVLADAMTYALRQYDPAYLVDVATLTGMIAAVLHEEYAGLYASDDGLARQLLASAERTGERLWRMPLSARLGYLVESRVADLANLGALGHFSNAGGSPTAGAKFLEHFAEGRKWAHLDISGPTWCSHASRHSSPGATGFGVKVLGDWLRELGAGSR